MRSDDFFVEMETKEVPVNDGERFEEHLREDLLEALTTGPLPGIADVSAAVGLLDLVEDELIEFGTSSNNRFSNDQSRLAIRELEAVMDRVGAPVKLPFSDFARFFTYWKQNGASGAGGWQARRDIIFELLDPPRQKLMSIERGLPLPKIDEVIVANLRDATAIREHLGRLQRALKDDPPLAIGTAKELVESTAKTVLAERGQSANDRDDLPKLVNQAQLAIGLHPTSGTTGPDSTDAVRKIMSGLLQIVSGLGELRNRGYGTGHGVKGARVGLRPRHAQLAVNAAMTWCSIMLDTLTDDGAPWRTSVAADQAVILDTGSDVGAPALGANPGTS